LSDYVLVFLVVSYAVAVPREVLVLSGPVLVFLMVIYAVLVPRDALVMLKAVLALFVVTASMTVSPAVGVPVLGSPLSVPPMLISRSLAYPLSILLKLIPLKILPFSMGELSL
jgi:hypothetical protein